jgi:hypothetical protein
VARRLLLLADGLLLVVAAFLAMRLYETASARAPSLPREGAPPVAVETSAAPPALPARPPLTAYAVVPERNLFSATRTEAAPEPTRAATGGGVTAPPAPKPRLYGIVLLPEGRGRAYLEDVQRRRVFGYSVGDLVGDARLEQIKSDRVVLRRGGETFEVLLYDPSKPRQPAARSSVQSPQAGGPGRPAAVRPPVPAPSTGIRPAERPRVRAPLPTPPSVEEQEQPTEEE